MNHLLKWCMVVAVVVAALVPVWTPQTAAAQDGDPLPRFEETDCLAAFSLARAEGVRCGYLVVPEDRADPDSPEIRLAVVVLSSNGSDPAPDPVIYLAGGPGGSSVNEAMFWATSPLRKDRDLILLDQRGTGFSQPSLDCPEMDAERIDLLAEPVTGAQWVDAMIEPARACHDRLRAENIDLAAYTSAANAADVADLRVALGYAEWNLYGISYGTRLALTVMRDHPEGVRSVVLDSVYPPDADLYLELRENAWRGLQTLFAGCAADTLCAGKYGDLEILFAETLAQLDADPPTLSTTHPLTGQPVTVTLTSGLLIETLFNALYRADLLPLLPALIDQFHAGNYATAGDFVMAFQIIPYFISDGMYFSVQCSEELPFSTAGAFEDTFDAVDLPGVNRVAAMGLIDYETCPFWGVNGADPRENAPVTSPIPALVVAGEYDPITPPRWAQQTADQLGNAVFAEFPGLAHGTTVQSACPRGIMRAFLADPITPPDLSCIDLMNPVDFR